MKEFYSEPDEQLKKRRFEEHKTRLIDPLFTSDKSAKILDLGCGYGLFLDSCKKLGYTNIEGVDSGGNFVKYAKKMLGLSSITCDDLFAYLESKNDDVYDVITAFNVMEHIKKDRVTQLLDLINGKLKPNGMLIIEIPNADSPLGVHTYFSDLTHEFAFSRKLIVQLLKNTGFDNIKVMYQPMRQNPLIKLAQKIMAKVVGFEYELMFSGNLIVASYKNADRN
jgi:2-polyprenyl-3-methyl-5-hydroxy-6-metoxy-1,4-benzoquinol methylase